MAYNNAGWLATVTTPGSVVTNYTYNALGESPHRQRQPRQHHPLRLRRTGPHHQGHRTRRHLQTAAYDAAGRSTTVRSYNSGSTILTTQSGTYNDTGAVTG